MTHASGSAKEARKYLSRLIGHESNCGKVLCDECREAWVMYQALLDRVFAEVNYPVAIGLRKPTNAKSLARTVRAG